MLCVITESFAHCNQWKSHLITSRLGLTQPDPSIKCSNEFLQNTSPQGIDNASEQILWFCVCFVCLCRPWRWLCNGSFSFLCVWFSWIVNLLFWKIKEVRRFHRFWLLRVCRNEGLNVSFSCRGEWWQICFVFLLVAFVASLMLFFAVLLCLVAIHCWCRFGLSCVFRFPLLAGKIWLASRRCHLIQLTSLRCVE